MTTERLLRKASLTLSTAAGATVLAAAIAVPSAHAQYAVSDTQLQGSIGTALRNDAKLGSSSITAKAAQGVVTLEGTVGSEDARLEAEQVVAGVSGVRSIQDNINITGNGAQAGAPAPQAAPEPQAPGTAESAGMPPAPPDAGPATPSGAPAASAVPPPPPDAAAQQQQYTPYPNSNGPTSQGAPQGAQGEYGNQAPAPYPQQGQYPSQQGQYPQAQGQYPQPYGYGDNGGYGPRGNSRPPQQPATLAVPPQLQNASGPVALPAGTLLSVRTTEPLSTNSLRGGEQFQVTAAADLYANGVIAIPRGAVLNGEVVESKNAGALAGSPKLELRLTALQLGGTTYPVETEVWSNWGPSKTGYTATNAAGGAIVGALIGAAAGGGIGAGIGAVAGGASGTLISGATHGPRLDLPPEALLQFHLAEPVTVQPLPYEEAARLASTVPQQPVLQRRPVYAAAPYPGVYVARPYPYAYAYPYGYYYRRY